MTDEAKALVERLRSQKDYKVVGFTPVTTVNPLCAEAADRIEDLTAENERLRAALAKIADGTMPRPLGEPWRMDMTSSKHDRCVHGAWMYEQCEGCIDAFIASVLGGANG